MNFIQKQLSKFITMASGEIAADLLAAQEPAAGTGWSAVLDRAGRIIAYQYSCEGRLLPNGVRVACKFQSNEIIPSVKLAVCSCKKKHVAYSCEIVCPMCSNTSALLDWIAAKKLVTKGDLPDFSKIPQRYGVPAGARGPQMIRTGPDMSAGDYTYEPEMIASVGWLK
jgi:hypothetical protein